MTPSPFPPASPTPPPLEGLDHLLLVVADPEAAADWYGRVFGAVAVAMPTPNGPRIQLDLPGARISLLREGRQSMPPLPNPVTGSGHFCLLTPAPLADWLVHFAALGVDVADGPAPRDGRVGRLESVYVYDPDGNMVEVARQVDRISPAGAP